MSTAGAARIRSAKAQPMNEADPTLVPARRKCGCGSPTSSLSGECAECSGIRLQRKLSVGASHDPLERDADQIADRVTAPAADFAFRTPAPQAQPFSAHVNDETHPGPASIERVLSSAGKPLETGLRQDMERRFGQDFSRVRVHSGPLAEQSARELSASAYTVANDIVFGAGRFAPGTSEGRRLIAHELTHVIQQSNDSIPADATTGQQPQSIRSNVAEPVVRPGRAASPYIARQAAPAYGNACSTDPNKADPCQLARCSPRQRTTAVGDFTTALNYVNASSAALGAAPLSGFTSRAMDWYFGGHDSATITKVSARLGCIGTSLTAAPGRYGCHPDYDALAYTCARGAGLCGHLAKNICFTTAHFGSKPRERAITAIHEAAHLEGMSTGSSSTNPDIYEHQNRFLDMSPAQAIQNADSYALFAAAIGTNDLPSTKLISAGISGGRAFARGVDPTWYFQGTLGLEYQHPRLRVFHPTLSAGFTLIGEAENPQTGARVSQSALTSVLLGLRIGESRRPGAGGGLELSLFGGPALSLKTGENPKLGAVAGVAFGYRWRMVDLSIGAGYAYDPFRSEAGAAHTATVGGTFAITFK